MTAVCLEIRSYELHPGTQEDFERIFSSEVVPMLRQWGHDVVFAGVSLHARDSFVLMRAYSSSDELATRQETFYGSAQWREGPRERVLKLIKAYTSAVLPITVDALNAWRAQLNQKLSNRN